MNMSYETERLRLEILSTTSVRPVLEFQLRNRELFERYEPTRPKEFYTLNYQHTLLKCEQKLALKMSTIRFYVFKNEEESPIIGTVCLHDVKYSPYCCCEIGYKFDHEYHHQGYAREAVAKALDIAFYDLNLHRVFARVLPENAPSIHLLESLGFELEGTERECMKIQGDWKDHLRYTLLTP